MDNKKIRERKFIDEIAQIYSDFPAGEILDGESPDFLIRQDSKIIGVELIDYVRGQTAGKSAARRNEVLWKKVADKAKEIFESKHGVPLLIYFHWDQRQYLRQAEVSQLANDVVRLVENHIPAQLAEPIWIRSDDLEGPLLGKFCRLITITKLRNDGQSLWAAITADFIRVQAKEIQYLIDAKNDKVPAYLGRCDEVWLIIVADGRFITSNIHLPQSTIRNFYTSCFERVLVYDRIGKEVFSLPLQRA